MTFEESKEFIESLKKEVSETDRGKNLIEVLSAIITKIEEMTK